jgi:protein TonB
MKYAAMFSILALASAACASAGAMDRSDMSRAASLKNPEAWVRAAYRSLPTEFVNGQGFVRMDVAVSPQGRVGECRITESTNYPALEVYACRSAQRYARYYPARNAAGDPIASEAELEFRLQF